MGAQLPGRTDNSCWRRSKTLAAMERGTFKQPSAPRGSGGRFLRAPTPAGRAASSSRRTPRQTGSGAGGSAATRFGGGDGETATEHGSEIDRNGKQSGRSGEDEGHAEQAASVATEAEPPRGGKGRGRGRARGNKRAAQSGAAKPEGLDDMGPDEGGASVAKGEEQEGAQDSGAGVAETEEGPQRKKPRKKAKR